MQPVIFSNQYSPDPSFYINEDSTSPGWSAYMFKGVKPKATISLDDSWNNGTTGSAYIFSNQAPKNLEDFFKNLQMLIINLAKAEYYFIWLRDPDSKLTGDNTDAIIVTSEAGGLKLQTVNINIGGYIYLSLLQNCTIDYSKDLQHFKINKSFGDIIFTNSLNSTDSEIDPHCVYLPFSGNTRGTFRFDMTMNGVNDITGYEVGLRYYYLDSSDANKVVTIKFPIVDTSYTSAITFQVSLDPLDQLNSKPEGTLRTFLALKDNQASIESYFRTSFGHQLDLSPKVDWLSNPDGVPYDIPSSTGAKLVFSCQKRDEHNIYGDSGAFYLVPQGYFHLRLDKTIDETSPVHDLMCGLSGIETVSFIPRNTNYLGDYLSFMPNQAAFSPVFPLPIVPETGIEEDQADEKANNNSAILLNNTYFTSWLTVLAADDRPDSACVVKENNNIRYLAQPKGGPLFNKLSNPKLLSFFQPTTANIMQLPKPVYFPLAAYTGIELTKPPNQPSKVDIEHYEQQIINPWRKSTIASVAIKQQAELQTGRLGKHLRTFKIKDLASTSAPNNINSTTAQGLFVNVDPTDDSWKFLALAKNRKTPHGDPITMQFKALGATLKSAFQTNQQFLVVSLNNTDPNSKGKKILGEFDNEMMIEGWPFIINVPEDEPSGDIKNVLIFKFCEGKLLDRVQNPKLWTSAENFNQSDDNFKKLSGWLTEYVKDGFNKGIGVNADPNFINFASKVNDPNWNGILALKTDISLIDFPQSLKGLIAGIDLTRFNAHHFGINANHVAPDSVTGELTMSDKSSLFGLINYVDEEFSQFDGNLERYKVAEARNELQNYYFKVLTLKVLFQNSKLESFQSYIQLSINNMFDNKVNVVSNENILILDGSYEDHGGTPVYSFTQTADNKLHLKNSVLYGVEILRASFTTLNTKDDPSDDIKTRFSLMGYMNFVKVNGIDLLSFGSPPNDEDGTPAFNSNQGLNYSNLGITMDFTLDPDAQAVSNKIFTFDPSYMSFDMSQSTSRKSSFYQHFPVQLSGITNGDDGSLPADQGYLSVSTPNLELSTPNGDWYGLECNLDMGTLGDLAGNAGLNSSLLINWGTGENAGVSVSVKLPGVNAKSKMFSLQGVLNLDIDAITLQMGEIKNDKGEVTGEGYLMMFTNIAMKLLSLKFPPGGDINFYLFGNPDNDAVPSSLGWYAAYQKNNSDDSKPTGENNSKTLPNLDG